MKSINEDLLSIEDYLQMSSDTLKNLSLHKIDKLKNIISNIDTTSLNSEQKYSLSCLITDLNDLLYGIDEDFN